MKLKKMLAVLLTVAMVISLLPVMAVTAEDMARGSLNAAEENSSIVFTKELLPEGNGTKWGTERGYHAEYYAGAEKACQQ